MNAKLKLTLLVAVVISQVFYVKFTINQHKRLNALRAEIKSNEEKVLNLKAGQVWRYKCTLPFHENDIPRDKTVTAIKDGFVQYTIECQPCDGGVLYQSCQIDIFTADSTLIKDVP